jgi:1,3-beta-glucan synthase
MLVIFIVIIAAPVVLRNTKMLDSFLKDTLWSSIGVAKAGDIGLLQPLDHGLNDTVKWFTGSGLPGGYSSSSVPTPSAGSNQWYI